MGPQRRGPASEERVIHLNYPAGDPLPHAWIEDEDGHRRPVKDLLRAGAVPAHRPGKTATPGARRPGSSPEAGIPLDAVRIGHLDGDLYDSRCAWQRQRQIASDGAVLVRPDRFIAWRHPSGASDPRAVLAAALS